MDYKRGQINEILGSIIRGSVKAGRAAVTRTLNRKERKLQKQSDRLDGVSKWRQKRNEKREKIRGLKQNIAAKTKENKAEKAKELRAKNISKIRKKRERGTFKPRPASRRRSGQFRGKLPFEKDRDTYGSRNL